MEILRSKIQISLGNKKTYILIIIIISACFSVHSQSGRELSNIIATADREFERHNYFGAAKLYERALESNRRMYDIVWKAAEAYRLDNDYIKAANYYKILVDNVANDYPDAVFYLAKMEKSNEEYVRAQYYFNLYYQNHKDKKEENEKVIRAKQEVRYCEYAWRMLRNPVGVTIKTFEGKINTINSEFAPFILGDSILYFSSIRPETDNPEVYRSKIYYSYIQDGMFSDEQALDSVINRPGYDVANPFLAADGRTIYFSAMKIDYQSESHIYRSYFDTVDNIWTSPELLPESINIPGYNSIHPSVANLGDNTYLLVWSSNRPGGEGGYDIWFSPLFEDGSFGIVRNVGRPIFSDLRFREFYDTTSVINTGGNEITPFYNHYDSTLYFSSDRMMGMGGYDIFGVKGNFQKWDTVINLGYPINTAQNDFYYKIFNEAGFAFLTSNRKGSPALRHHSCCNALYYYEIEKIAEEEEIVEERIEFITEQTKLLVPIELYFDNDRPVPRSWDTVTDLTYSETFYAYLSRLEEFRVGYSRGLSRSERQTAIDSINMFFADLVEKNYYKLLEFTKLTQELLKEGQTIEITIKGFTSPLNVAEYNINLSKRRIASLVNYFYEFDDGFFIEYIESGQMSFEFVAYGETLADASVSADPTDLRSSVFSPAASRERRIEIIAVSITDENLIQTEDE